jgi:hypothetical protein
MPPQKNPIRRSDAPAPKRGARSKRGRKGEGRPPFEPTDRQRALVRSLSIGGMPQAEICKAIRNPDTGEALSKPTLMLHFREELDDAFAQTAALCVSDFMRKCTGANAVIDRDTGQIVRAEVKSETKAQIFYMETKLKNWGWSRRLEMTGKDGAPIPTSFAMMTDEQLDEFIARTAGKDGTPAGG